MTNLELWLQQAACGLSADSAASVRAEIQEHYQSARDAAISDGASQSQAEHSALAALGDPKLSNRLYRKVLLTKAEARLLREINWESRAVCANRQRLMLLPVAALAGAIWFFIAGNSYLGAMLLMGAAGLSLLLASGVLPIFTPARGRIFRVVRWSWLAAMLMLVLGPNPLSSSWLVFACAWPLAWVELRLFSLRRKLPVADWPKQLYL